MSKDWIILRCASVQTLRLAQSLRWAGIDAWSPSIVETPRKGRSRSRRPRRIPLMGSFVFARHEHISDLVALKEALSSPHARFSFMRNSAGDIGPLPDCQLDALRVAEQIGQPKQQAKQWEVGQSVRCPAAGFEGLVGIVEGKKGKFVLVAFPGWNEPAKVSAPLLLDAA